MKTFRSRAFVAVDMLMGIGIISVTSVALIGAIRRESSVEHELADSRAAIHLAEHSLLNLQHGLHLPDHQSEVRLTIARVIGGVAPAGYVWAKVEVSIHGHARSLLGVVPASSIPSPREKS